MTKLTSRPFRILLDKGIARSIYEFQARLGKGDAPTPTQIETMKAWIRIARFTGQVYITQQSANVLQLRQPKYANEILNNTEMLRKGRYLRRWARRLRDYVFTREDAVIIAYASFGVDLASGNLGADAIVTTDLHLARNFDTRHSEIQERFDLMVKSLAEPYRGLSLPEVVTPAVVLTKW